MGNPTFKTPRAVAKAWHQAQAGGMEAARGCYFTPACRQPAIQAHTVSRAWLRTLADGDGRVYWFSRRGEMLSGALNVLLQGGWQRPLEKAPDRVHVGKATARPFCCKEHDEAFKPIDQRESIDWEAPSRYQLTLMFYRALLRQLYMTSAREALRDSPPMFQWMSRVPGWLGDNAKNLQSPRCVLQGALEKAQGTSWRVRHQVKNIPGRPCVAAAVAAPAISKPWNRRRITGAWGCTVVPHAQGHLVAYHYCTVLPSNRAAARDLQERDRHHARKLVEDTGLPYRLSWDLVSTCEELCVAPAAWDAYPDEVKNAIRECFLPRPLGKAPPFNLFA